MAYGYNTNFVKRGDLAKQHVFNTYLNVVVLSRSHVTWHMFRTKSFHNILSFPIMRSFICNLLYLNRRLICSPIDSGHWNRVHGSIYQTRSERTCNVGWMNTLLEYLSSQSKLLSDELVYCHHHEYERSHNGSRFQSRWIRQSQSETHARLLVNHQSVGTYTCALSHVRPLFLFATVYVTLHRWDSL